MEKKYTNEHATNTWTETHRYINTETQVEMHRTERGTYNIEYLFYHRATRRGEVVNQGQQRWNEAIMNQFRDVAGRIRGSEIVQHPHCDVQYVGVTTALIQWEQNTSERGLAEGRADVHAGLQGHGQIR